jgi:inosose dehydratase
MLIHGYHLGIQSWTFRACKTHEDVIAAARACGVDALELCGVHLDVGNAEAAAAALAQYRAAGITLSAWGVHGFGTDAAANQAVFEFARAAGMAAVSADLDPAAIDLVERQCAEYGVKLAMHNHGRKHRYGTVRELEALFARTSPAIGLCLDTAWMLDAGEEPAAVARHFADRLYGLHVKDFTFSPDGRSHDVVVGTGNLDLRRLFTTLQEIGFSGYTTLEFEGDADNPIPSVQACLANLRASEG